jgi:hypothetical protein
MQTQKLINSLQALYQPSRSPVVPENTPLNKLEPGQRIQATIQEQVGPGLYKLQVGGQTLQMQLPGQLKNGNTVQLQVTANSPRLTFSVVASDIAALEQRNTATSNNPLVTNAQLSATSRLLSSLTESPMARTHIQSTEGSAVWPATDKSIDGKQLASALKDALGNSGLFYESHQAQWVRGERSTAQLLIEPQNRFQEPDAQSLAMQQDKAPAHSGTQITGELMTMVQQQLHTLETHQLTWTGDIWPGQQMQWEIEGEPEHHPRHADERRWSTEMELALPTLGDVHARLVFSQGGIKLNLYAANPDTVTQFNRSLPSLARTLADAGIPLTAAVIEKT